MYAVWAAEIIKGVSRSRPHGTPWVARITGTDARWEFKREFLRGLRDYSHGQEHHTRGVYLYFNLAPGVYDFYRPVSWKHEERFYGLVDEDGEIHEINKEAITAWLTSHESAI